MGFIHYFASLSLIRQSKVTFSSLLSAGFYFGIGLELSHV